MAHLLTGVHEQNYIAHVMGFASCYGPYKYDCDRGVVAAPSVQQSRGKTNSGVALNPQSGVLISAILLVFKNVVLTA